MTPCGPIRGPNRGPCGYTRGPFDFLKRKSRGSLAWHGVLVDLKGSSIAQQGTQWPRTRY